MISRGTSLFSENRNYFESYKESLFIIMLERTANLLQYCLQLTLFIVSGSPSNTMLGEVTKIICLELKDLWGWYCFAANSFYCLRLPIQYNARGRWPKYFAWNVKSCGVNAASQQTYFIVSGSPSNIMLGGGNQNTVLGK